MDESWQIAELIEDIARNADPVSAVKKMLSGKPTALVVYGYSHDDEPDAHLMFRFSIPQNYDGDPQEIVDYLHTGLGPDERVELVQDAEGNKHVHVTQFFDDPARVDDIKECSRLADEALERLKRERVHLDQHWHDDSCKM